MSLMPELDFFSDLDSLNDYSSFPLTFYNAEAFSESSITSYESENSPVLCLDSFPPDAIDQETGEQQFDNSPLKYSDSFNLAEQQIYLSKTHRFLSDLDTGSLSPVFCRLLNECSFEELQLQPHLPKSTQIDPSKIFLTENKSNNFSSSITCKDHPVNEFCINNFESKAVHPINQRKVDFCSKVVNESEILEEQPEQKTIFNCEQEAYESKTILQQRVLPASCKSKSSPPLLPVKIIIKKVQNKLPSEPEMVAPAKIPETSFTLVRIPSSCEIGSNRTSYLRKGGKLGPTQNSVPNLSGTDSYNFTKSEEASCLEINKLNIDAPAFNETSGIESKMTSINTTSSKSLEKRQRNLQNLPFTSIKRKCISSGKSHAAPKKIKVYELDPLPDPSLEKCRRNAVNAKKNRDIKKAKMIALEAEVKLEREEKLRLVGENESLKIRQAEMEDRLKCITELLMDPSKLSSLLEKVNKLDKGVWKTDITEDILNAQYHLGLQMGRQTS